MQKMERKEVRVLLVEDSSGDANLLLELLKDFKVEAEITVAKDGKEALAHLKDSSSSIGHPDLIILDLKLPGMSGHEILRRIKSDPSLRFIPVIVLSSSSDEADIIKSYDLQASCYITKPNDLYRYEEAVEIIERFWFKLVKLPAHYNSGSYINNI
jgi:CheY-like chemotaxis protein